MHRRCCRLVTWMWWNVTSLQHLRCIIPPQVVKTTQSSAPEDGRNYRPKHVELIELVNKLSLLHVVGCLYNCINYARSHKHQIHNKNLQFNFHDFKILPKSRMSQLQRFQWKENFKSWSTNFDRLHVTVEVSKVTFLICATNTKFLNELMRSFTPNLQFSPNWRTS